VHHVLDAAYTKQACLKGIGGRLCMRDINDLTERLYSTLLADRLRRFDNAIRNIPANNGTAFLSQHPGGRQSNAAGGAGDERRMVV
jgi:hypothetical protein